LVTNRITRGLVFGAAAVAVAVYGCGGSDVTAPNSPGTLSFTYAGLLSGTFDASGTLKDGLSDFDPDPDDEGAVAWDFTSDNPDELSFHEIESKQQTGADFPDEFAITLVNVNQAGTYSICPAGDLPANGCVLSGSFYPRNSDDFLGFHVFTEINLIITSFTANRIQGTFSGTVRTTVTDPITITSGMLDVPIRKP
jgi:hypothetical protein